MNENKVIGKVKKIHFGQLLDLPAEGEFLIIIENRKSKRLTNVTKFMSFYSDRLWVVETRNSIYVLEKEE